MTPSIIRAMIWLRLRRVLADRLGLVWLLVMPMVFSLLMGQLMGDWSGDQKPAGPRFMVYDLDGGQYADQLLAPLLDQDNFRLVRVDTVASKVAIERAVDKRYIAGALVIPPRFSDAITGGDTVLLQLYYDSERLSSQTVHTRLMGAILKLNAVAAARTLVIRPEPGQTLPADRAAEFNETVFIEAWTQPRVTVGTQVLGRVAAKQGLLLENSAQHVGPAYTCFFMMMFLLLSAKDLVNERKDHTLSRLMVSRATSLDLLSGFFLGGIALGLIQATVLLVLNSLAFGIDYGDSVVGLVLGVVLFAGVCSAGSVLLGCLARTGAQADGLGMTVTMVLAALGGLWWPLEIVPPFMQKIGHSLPSGQIITIFHDMIGRGAGVQELAGLLTGLAAWFLILFVAGTWRLRKLIVT